jgi:hypothetical protein
VLNSTKNKELEIEDHPVLWEYKDAFPEEVPGLPPKRDLYLSPDLVPGSIPTLKVPYRMNIPELVYLKVQLKEMMDKGYIRLGVSLWGAPMIFLKKKDGTLWLCIDYQ